MRPRAIRIWRGRDNSELASLPLGEAEKRWGGPYLVIHRADLQKALADVALARGADLRLGFEVAGVAETPDGVALGLKRGALSLRESGDLVVGADGLRSRVRERLGLGGPGDMLFSGRVAFRATVPADLLPARFAEPEVNLRIGSGAIWFIIPARRLGRQPRRLDRIGLAGRKDRRSLGRRGRPARLVRAFHDWSRETRDLIAGAEHWRAWPLNHREPIASYAHGRVALIGDAAHPMVPFLAQGAGQAIEDAGALERRLEATPDIAAALADIRASAPARGAGAARGARPSQDLPHARTVRARA